MLVSVKTKRRLYSDIEPGSEYLKNRSIKKILLISANDLRNQFTLKPFWPIINFLGVAANFRPYAVAE